MGVLPLSVSCAHHPKNPPRPVLRRVPPPTPSPGPPPVCPLCGAASAGHSLSGRASFTEQSASKARPRGRLGSHRTPCHSLLGDAPLSRRTAARPSSCGRRHGSVQFTGKCWVEASLRFTQVTAQACDSGSHNRSALALNGPPRWLCPTLPPAVTGVPAVSVSGFSHPGGRPLWGLPPGVCAHQAAEHLLTARSPCSFPGGGCVHLCAHFDGVASLSLGCKGSR